MYLHKRIYFRKIGEIIWRTEEIRRSNPNRIRFLNQISIGSGGIGSSYIRGQSRITMDNSDNL